jgi:hypothetical protein
VAWSGAPRTWSTGELVTAASLNTEVRDRSNEVWWERDYTEKTSSTAISATTEATANTVITSAPLDYDGASPVRLQFYSPEIAAGTSNDSHVVIVLYEDGTSVGFMGRFVGSGAGSVADSAGATLVRRLTPAAGTHTYSIRAYRVTANGTVLGGAGGAGAYMPATLTISQRGGA